VNLEEHLYCRGGDSIHIDLRIRSFRRKNDHSSWSWCSKDQTCSHIQSAMSLEGSTGLKASGCYRDMHDCSSMSGKFCKLGALRFNCFCSASEYLSCFVPIWRTEVNVAWRAIVAACV